MCGIAGMIAPEGKTITDEQVRRMTNTIIHRGPDDEGIFAQGNVGLGMRRLSIIDLSGGSQPIYNEDRSVAVVFNGEIYNFRELRKDLEGRGHRFYTHTDTEVIVHLYEEMGADCVKKLRGMFAIALYDERQHSLLLARDRLGKKPLHYAWYGGELLFGSEIKTILALRPEWAVVDREGLLQYFYFGYIPDPHPVFGRIRKLPAGHLIEFGGLAERRSGLFDHRRFDGASKRETGQDVFYWFSSREVQRIRIRAHGCGTVWYGSSRVGARAGY